MPARIMCAKAHGISGDPGVRFTVPSSYGDAAIEGRTWWPTFEEAVAAARSTIEEKTELLPYMKPGDRTHTRAFVALRASWHDAPRSGVGLGSDAELLRWEVFADRVALDAGDHEAVLAEPAPQGGWA